MISVALATLGCKVNQYESAGMAETLRENGYSPVAFNGAADIYIINTCTVTGKADFQSRQLIRRAARHNPRAAILVTGCYAQVLPEEIALLPGVTMVAGNVEKGDILGLFREMAAGVKQSVQSDIRRVTEFSTPATGAFAGRTRAFLKIQDGCDCFCSYCIVPYARGKSRSLAGKEVLKRIQAIGQAGHRELVLTGINLGAYGRDLQPACDLPGLLRQVAGIKQLPRLRLSSLEPLEITDALLEFMRDKDIFCRHLHIPMQSGDDGILAAMGRVYDGAFFRGLAHKILTYLPTAAIGVDVMVGFPGEGEAEFAHTRQLVEELPLAYLHVFSYSPRPGTPAAARSDQVGVADIKRRGSIMRQLGISKREAFARQFLGREMTVLLESKRDRETGWTQGFSNNYIPVVVRNGQSSLPGSLMTVLAEEARDGKLIGRIIHHD